MVRICFVCHGNICRSPMAEFVMKALVKRAGREKEFLIVSKATHTDEIWNGTGAPIYPPAQTVMQRKGIPFDHEKRATLLKKRDYEKYDLFIGMDRENMRCMPRLLGGDSEGKIHRLLDYTHTPRDVSDPWYTRDFDQCYQDIEKGCTALLNTILSASPC
ncbi:MAG: low molecular weight phosphotyrosine protein phosphatase [Eubacterium sp.]|nr:low molecular weight phosphotyrosine protein phosphatase [Eubacterium sp.]